MLGAGLWDIIIPRLLAVAEFLALTAVGVGALYVAYRLLARLAARTKTTVDDRIIAATKRPALVSISLASLRAVAPSLGLPDEVHVALYYALLLLAAVMAARVAAVVVDEAFAKMGIPSEKRGAVVRVAKLGVMALGLVGVLSCYLNAAMSFLVSMGVLGFVLTFSLQYPLANLIGWVYIMASNILKVGDRVRIGESYGIVSSINHFTTELAEVDEHGMLSGRTLIVPNSAVLSERVTRWATNPPTLLDSVAFTLAYESDLRHVEGLMLKKAEELYEEFKLTDVVKQPHEVPAPGRGTVKPEPRVFFEPVEGGWISAKLVYRVPLGIRYEFKSALTKKVLEAFNADPERVKFPVGRAR